MTPSPWETTTATLSEKKKWMTKKTTTSKSELHATSCSLCRAAHQAPAAARKLVQSRRRRHLIISAAAVVVIAGEGRPAPAVFECRTCGRQFTTFQALGGHRTSHFRRPAAAKKLRPKHVVVAHACGTCGLGFSTGQALGGHMRRHRGHSTTTTANDSASYVGLTRIIVQERPSSASLQLLNLFA